MTELSALLVVLLGFYTPSIPFQTPTSREDDTAPNQDVISWQAAVSRLGCESRAADAREPVWRVQEVEASSPLRDLVPLDVKGARIAQITATRIPWTFKEPHCVGYVVDVEVLCLFNGEVLRVQLDRVDDRRNEALVSWSEMQEQLKTRLSESWGKQLSGDYITLQRALDVVHGHWHGAPAQAFRIICYPVEQRGHTNKVQRVWSIDLRGRAGPKAPPMGLPTYFYDHSRHTVDAEGGEWRGANNVPTIVPAGAVWTKEQVEAMGRGKNRLRDLVPLENVVPTNIRRAPRVGYDVFPTGLGKRWIRVRRDSSSPNPESLQQHRERP